MVYYLAQAQLLQPTTIPVPVVVDPMWTPTAVITVATVIVALIAGTLIPAIIALVKATRAEIKAEASVQSAKVNAEISERQQGVLDTLQQNVPVVPGSGSLPTHNHVQPGQEPKGHA